MTAASMRGAARLARAAGLGGSVIGGHLGLRLDPGLLAKLAAHRRIVTVSATNGKTTTTNLLTAALATAGPVVTNAQGSNLATGLAAALAGDLTVERAALEVDEATLAATAHELSPTTMVLANLSRDQLDRYGEVRIVAEKWRDMLTDLARVGKRPHVVANADDPLVTWSVAEHADVTWVSVGSPWTADALVCPDCAAPVIHSASDWHCTGCDLARPTPAVSLVDHTVTLHDAEDRTVELDLSLPGAFNLANATMALAAARLEGIDPSVAAAAMRATDEVAGRYATIESGGRRIRLLMAKNPAGWQSSLAIVAPPPTPIVVAINARIADGRDPSWLWDVPFERLAGRRVVAAGDRAADLAVRLHYGGVDHEVHPGSALDACRTLPVGPIDLVANYTAFSDVLAAR
jgi:UDP-N-acetylmuramyl tripeptide synthase